MSDEIGQKIKSLADECLVLLKEEYGYQNWFWFPQMTPMMLENWWRDLKTVEPYYFEPKYLPGELVKVTRESMQLYEELLDAGKHFYSHINLDHDSFLRTPTGKIVYHVGSTDPNRPSQTEFPLAPTREMTHRANK